MRLRAAMEEGGVEIFARIRKCPRCGQRCLKEGYFLLFFFASLKRKTDSKGPFTVSVCVSVSITLSLDTMDFNRTIHSERDANSIAISVMLMLMLNLTLNMNRPKCYSNNI